MNKMILSVGSATYAIKGRKLLLREGIGANTVKLAGIELGGCTHGIEISETDIFSAAATLKNAGISYKVYRGNSNDLP